MGTRIRIQKDTELSATPYSLIRTNATGEQEYLAAGNIGEALVVDTDGIPKYLPTAAYFTFDITDGTTTQTISSGDVIEFTQGDGISLSVSATDLVNIAAKISADANNGLSIGTDGGLYADLGNLIQSGSWDDTTNSIVFTLADGSTVTVPISDLIGTWLFDLTIVGDTGTDVVNNHETLTFVGGTGIITTVTDNTVTIESTVASGTVTDVSIANSNGFNGTVATSTTTPVITLSTTITGILEGNGTAISAASVTGSGAVVLDTGASLTNPILGNATATTINKVTITQPATGATLTIQDGFTLTVNGNGSVSGTNTGDNAVNTLYSGLITNATHTGEVTGSSVLVVDKTAITNQTAVTYDSAVDYVLISDGSDGGNLKKAYIPSGGSTSPTILTPAQIIAWQNNYTAAGTLVANSILRLDFNSSSSFITGFDASVFSDGEEFTIVNIGTYLGGIQGNSSASTAANRVAGGDIYLPPNNGVTLFYDSTSARFRVKSHISDVEGVNYSMQYKNHFLQKTNDSVMNYWTSGSGASAVLNGSSTIVNTRPGVVTFSTGTTSTGYAQIFGNDASDPNKMIVMGSGITMNESLVMIPTVSDATDRFVIKSGAVNSYSSPTGATIEIDIIYSDNINSGNWTLRTQSASTTTDVNSAIPVVANTWYRIKWVCYNGTKVHFWIDGVYVGESTTNIPLTTELAGMIFSIWKTAGTNARTVNIDYFNFIQLNYKA